MKPLFESEEKDNYSEYVEIFYKRFNESFFLNNFDLVRNLYILSFDISMIGYSK